MPRDWPWQGDAGRWSTLWAVHGACGAHLSEALRTQDSLSVTLVYVFCFLRLYIFATKIRL